MSMPGDIPFESVQDACFFQAGAASWLVITQDKQLLVFAQWRRTLGGYLALFHRPFYLQLNDIFYASMAGGGGQGFMREKRHVSGFGYSHRSRQSHLSYDHIFVTFKVESLFVQYVFWSSSEVLVVSYRQIKSFNNRAGNCHALYPALTHGVRMGAHLFKGTTSSLFAAYGRCMRISNQRIIPRLRVFQLGGYLNSPLIASSRSFAKTVDEFIRIVDDFIVHVQQSAFISLNRKRDSAASVSFLASIFSSSDICILIFTRNMICCSRFVRCASVPVVGNPSLCSLAGLVLRATIFAMLIAISLTQDSPDSRFDSVSLNSGGREDPIASARDFVISSSCSNASKFFSSISLEWSRILESLSLTSSADASPSHSFMPVGSSTSPLSSSSEDCDSSEEYMFRSLRFMILIECLGSERLGVRCRFFVASNKSIPKSTPLKNLSAVLHSTTNSSSSSMQHRHT
mmetsp:Transcript_24176/g.33062  ORF Transcript_24176/g.33062 Transcript_24176/m.33062 type:complete len:458 (+) Transcript_24176:418-1791(+)